MLALEAWCYLAVVAATCGAYVAGRGTGGPFRWARRGALALLAGVLVTLQVRLAAFGLVTHWAGHAAASAALAGVLALMALDVAHDAGRGGPTVARG